MRQGQLRSAAPAQQRAQIPCSVRRQGRCGSQIRAAAAVEAEQIKKYVKGIKPKVSCIMSQGCTSMAVACEDWSM